MKNLNSVCVSNGSVNLPDSVNLDAVLNDMPEEFNQIDGVDTIAFVLGLNFPEFASDQQKSLLTLAGLMASVRDNVLAGRPVNDYVQGLIIDLVCVAFGLYEE